MDRRHHSTVARVLRDHGVPKPVAPRPRLVDPFLPFLREQVRIIDDDDVVAEHARSFDKGQQIEDPSHIEALAKEFPGK